MYIHNLQVNLGSAFHSRLHVAGGECSMCKQNIPPSEKVMKFKNNLNYHLNCFYCVYCQCRFNVGDSVYIPKPNIILCQRHWLHEALDNDSLEALFLAGVPSAGQPTRDATLPAVVH